MKTGYRMKTTSRSGQPYKKDDNAHMEHKNWMRRLLG